MSGNDANIVRLNTLAPEVKWRVWKDVNTPVDCTSYMGEYNKRAMVLALPSDGSGWNDDTTKRFKSDVSKLIVMANFKLEG